MIVVNGIDLQFAFLFNDFYNIKTIISMKPKQFKNWFQVHKILPTHKMFATSYINHQTQLTTAQSTDFKDFPPLLLCSA